MKRSDSKRRETPIAQARTWSGEIPIHSFYTAGVAGQIFFTALKERGVLLGSRCRACEQVYFPMRQFCERCFAELSEQIEVGPQGTLTSFTFCHIDRDGKRLDPPLVLALAQLERATTVCLHYLIGITEPSQVEIGSRVELVIKPKAKRAGSILDIEGFRLP
ncbi:MAG: Zn-ribbon domain-containing OB-fold protein [Deltaproteobacteria bacterium]|nr:Zn-ribbon domain-containing OB-fold protein [Deltaproteobacteria bacterium]